MFFLVLFAAFIVKLLMMFACTFRRFYKCKKRMVAKQEKNKLRVLCFVSSVYTIENYETDILFCICIVGCKYSLHGLFDFQRRFYFSFRALIFH
jgi:hypothetical protein